MTHFNDINAVNHTEGLQNILIYVAGEVPIFIPLVLFGFFVIIAMGSFFSAQRLRGKGDFSVSFAIAGYVTMGAALLMSLIDGLINLTTIMIVLGVSILGTLWLFFSKER